MPASLVQTLGTAVSSAAQQTITLATTAATTAGNSIVCSCVQASGSGFTSVTDSVGNTYTLEKQTSTATALTIATFVARDIAAIPSGGTITLTSASSSQYPVLSVHEFTPLAGSDDAVTSATDGGVQSSSYSVPGVAIPSGDHLLIGDLGMSGAGRSQTPSAGWNKLGANGDSAPTFARTVMSMWGAQDGGILSATGTFSATGNWAVHLLAFPAASVVTEVADSHVRVGGVLVPAVTRYRVGGVLVPAPA